MNIIHGNTLSDDGLPGKQFDYMLSNPPFGVEWKKIQKEIKKEHQQDGFNVEGQFNVNNHAHLICGKGNCSTKWASLYFEHKDLSPWLIKQGVGRMKLRKEKLQTIPILVPPPQEQDEILAEANRVKETTKSLIAEAERAIELLQERRTALISAAVTGKIDVRGFANKEAVA